MDSRTKILNAASELFLEGGVSALSVRAISKRAGLSTIGIYSHFQGKQGILDTLYIEGFNLVYDAMQVESDERLTIDDMLRSCRGYLDVATNNEAHYRLIFGEGDAGYEPSEEARAAADRAFGKLVNNAGDFIRAAGLGVDRLVVAMDIWAILHGYVSISHHARANQDLDWQAMALRAAELHMRALK